ncbi:MAG TPA: hypothetical protein ENK14_07090 [Caldithrix sp.]|nr:hypothetical protein [Caldithrix sp.]
MWKNGNRALSYLAGAIEKAPDAGCKWRAEISRFLEKELGHAVFNPCLEESHVLTAEEFRHFREWKANDLPRFRRVVHKIIQTDISTLLNKVDYIICLWDEYVLHGGGTHGELTMAYWHEIPVYMVTRIPLAEMSSWIIGCTTRIFSDFDQLRNFLRNEFRDTKNNSEGSK